MSDKRFELTKINPTVNLSDTVYFIIDYENPNKEIRTLKDCVGLLNEQQATIERLTKRRDRWRELSNSFSAYCNCYEKAIERAFEEKPCPSEEDIYRIYAELEKELENE